VAGGGELISFHTPFLEVNNTEKINIECPDCGSSDIKDSYAPQGSNPKGSYVIVCGGCGMIYFFIPKIKTEIVMKDGIYVGTRHDFVVRKDWPYNLPPKMYTFLEKYGG